ncbi:MAG: hypothetical protein NTV34_13525 [Proteobacteria bacterium]|nr:hypothetical protein [Pseudomonadota bacterium]
MNMSPSNVFGLLAVSLTLSWLPSELRAQRVGAPSESAKAPVAPRTLLLRQPVAPRHLGLNLSVTMGIGSFQDLQAPLAASGERRVDGTTTIEDSSNHAGVLLTGALQYEVAHDYGNTFVTLSGHRASSSTPVVAPAATYSRYGLSVGNLMNIGGATSVTPLVELRRSMYRNTDNGHFLDAVMMGAGLEQRIDSVLVSLSGAISAVSRFGYMQDSSKGKSGTLRDTSSGASEVSARAAYKPVPEVDFYVCLSQEQVRASLADINAYESFGLNISDERGRVEERSVSLTTNLLEFGAVRRF